MGARLLPEVPDQLPLGRDSIAWKVNSEPLVFAGGGRALLMQVAHPGVGAGVEQHSTYARDPWGRLFRTVDVMMKLSFGSPEQSARQQRMLDKMHRRVNGTTDLGDAYSAHDTNLQLWVWATLVDTALVVYELVRGRLPDDEREQYYVESKLVAYGCGVPVGACPETLVDFGAYIDRVVAEDLVVTRSAEAVAVASMVPPLPWGLGGVAAVPNQLMTSGLLPPSLREPLGLEWTPSMQRSLDLWIRGARLMTSTVPTPLRRAPAVLAINQKHALRLPWLQRRGAQLTADRLDAAGYAN